MQRPDAASVLVTGGAGFIGSHLCAALVQRPARVRVLDNLSTGRRGALPAGIEFIEGDIRDRDTVRRAVEGIEQIYHLAALVSVPRSIEDPQTATDINVQGTYLVLAEAVRAKVRRLVFASSSSVYGIIEKGPNREEDPPHPLSPYGASKLAAEIACRSFARSTALETVALRFFNVFGPGQDPKSPYAAVIPIFLSHLLAGEPITIYGDGQQTRDFTFVTDVVDGLIRAGNSEGVSGEVINLAGGNPTTVLEVAQKAGTILGIAPKIRHEPARRGDVRHSKGDVTRAERLLKFRTQVTFEDGLRRTAEWLRGRSPESRVQSPKSK